MKLDDKVSILWVSDTHRDTGPIFKWVPGFDKEFSRKAGKNLDSIVFLGDGVDARKFHWMVEDRLGRGGFMAYLEREEEFAPLREEVEEYEGKLLKGDHRNSKIINRWLSVRGYSDKDRETFWEMWDFNERIQKEVGEEFKEHTREVFEKASAALDPIRERNKKDPESATKIVFGIGNHDAFDGFMRAVPKGENAVLNPVNNLGGSINALFLPNTSEQPMGTPKEIFKQLTEPTDGMKYAKKRIWKIMRLKEMLKENDGNGEFAKMMKSIYGDIERFDFEKLWDIHLLRDPYTRAIAKLYQKKPFNAMISHRPVPFEMRDYFRYGESMDTSIGAYSFLTDGKRTLENIKPYLSKEVKENMPEWQGIKFNAGGHVHSPALMHADGGPGIRPSGRTVIVTHHDKETGELKGYEAITVGLEYSWKQAKDFILKANKIRRYYDQDPMIEESEIEKMERESRGKLYRDKIIDVSNIKTKQRTRSIYGKKGKEKILQTPSYLPYLSRKAA